jgi:hypothetical protein
MRRLRILRDPIFFFFFFWFALPVLKMKRMTKDPLLVV